MIASKRKIVTNAHTLLANPGEFAIGSWIITQGKILAPIKREIKSVMSEKSCWETSLIAPLIRKKTTMDNKIISKKFMSPLKLTAGKN